VHTTWLAAVIFAVLAGRFEGAVRFDGGQMLAIGYLAVGVTAVAFILWYSCVDGLGAGRAGLLTGVAPVAAAVIGVFVSGAMPGVAVWAGIGLIVSGLWLGPALFDGDGLGEISRLVDVVTAGLRNTRREHLQRNRREQRLEKR
jgi:threonine/homoserine efflux transporter RhtA